MAPIVPPPSPSTSPINNTAALNAAITIKLDQDNFLLWKAQALPALYSHDVYGFVDGTKAAPRKKVAAAEGRSEQVANPEYATWFRQDQQVLSGLLGSLTPVVMGHVFLLKTSAEVWGVLDRMFSSK
jgi:hypothetical protein